MLADSNKEDFEYLKDNLENSTISNSKLSYNTIILNLDFVLCDNHLSNKYEETNAKKEPIKNSIDIL